MNRMMALILFRAGLLGILGLWSTCHAADFACPAGDVACLISSIHAANANGQANTITLAAGTYALAAVDNGAGLPSITSDLVIRGAGAANTSLERLPSGPSCRLVDVAETGSLTLQGLTLHGFRDPISGGGIRNSGTLTIRGSTLSENTASDSCGGVMNSGTAIIVGSTLAGNAATDSVGFSGGVCNSGTMTIVNSTLSGNSATVGGAIGNSGTLAITKSTLSGNHTRGAFGWGGGIVNSGTLTITNSSLSDNHAAGAFGPGGGAIANLGTLTITNSTVGGNTTESLRDGGGGIANFGTLTITNSTISGNAAYFVGGGIFSELGSVTVQNTILALNTSVAGNVEDDCFGPVTSLGNNVFGDLTGCVITLLPTDLTADPGLGAFTDNGIPGNGHFPLLPTSRAIDAGNDAACPPTDQLGQRRARRCDIGAIEFKTPAEMIADLIDKTLIFAHHMPLGSSLRSQLEWIAAAVVAKKLTLACGLLNLSIAAVNAAPSTVFTAAQKAELVADANAIKTAIGCPQ